MSFRNWLKHLFAVRPHAGRATDAINESHIAAGDGDDADLFDPFPEPLTIEITDVLDLHTIAPRDTERAVEAYLVEAHRAGFPSVRLIHGKGKGVQRELVRKILARTPFVRDWSDAPPQAGGWGATVAHFGEGKRQQANGKNEEFQLRPR